MKQILQQFTLRASLLVMLLVGAVGSMWGETYTLVKSASELSVGDIILITSGKDGNVKALGAQNTNNRYAVDITINNEVISSIGTASEIELHYFTGKGFNLKDGDNYLYAANSESGTNNYLKSSSSKNQVYWTIEINPSTFAATIKDYISTCNNRNWLRYNSSSKLFSCYGSGQNDVYIFKKQVDSQTSTTTTTISAIGITNTDVYQGSNAGTLIATVTPDGGSALSNPVITWSSSDENVATINANGVVTLVAAGTTIITASYAGETGIYSASEATYELTVTNSAPIQAENNWVETSLADLTASDVFIIVGNNGGNYALSNDNGTNSAPSAVAVTVADGKITSTVADNMKWTISGNGTDGYTFYPDGSTTTWLYCTNANNGVRVGDNDNKAFKLDHNYLMHIGTSRYLGIYSSQDWRCYTSYTTTNIANQTFTFYKRVSANEPTLSASDVELEYNATSGSIVYTLENTTGGTMSAETTADWLTIGTAGVTIPFTCDANSTASERTATVTLTYSLTSGGTLTSTVTVTQAANPNAVSTIAEVRSQGTGSVQTKGIVTSVNGKTAYIQDATAAIAVYNSAAELTVAVGDEIKVSGTLGTYSGLLQIQSPTINVISNGNTVTPEVMTISQVNASNNQGWLVKIEEAKVTEITDKNVTIAQGENTIVVRFNNTEDITVTENDIVTLTGNIGCYNTTKQIANPTDIVKKELITVTLTFNDVPSTIVINETATYIATANPAVTGIIYTSDSENVTVNESTGEITAVALGEATITATFDGNTEYKPATASYTITVVAPQHIVKFFVNGEEQTEEEVQVSEGAAITFPTATPTIEGKTFVGWTTAAIDGETDNAPTFVTSATMGTADVTYYAVYANQEGEGGSSTATLTEAEIKAYFTAKVHKYADGEVAYNDTEDGINWTASYNVDNADRPWIQLKKDATAYLKIEASSNISEVKLTITAASNSSGGITDITKHNPFGGEVYLETEVSSSPTGALGLSGEIVNNVVTLVPSSSVQELFIQVSAAARIWGVEVTAGTPASYSGYCTTVTTPEQPITVTIGSVGYTTFVAPADVSFPEGVEAFIVTAISTSSIHMEPVTAVPSGTPVVVRAAEGTHNLSIATETDDFADNKLRASDGNVTGDGTIYALGNKNAGVGFYPVKSGAKVPAGKAYLVVNNENIKEFFSFDFGGLVTEINNVNTNVNANAEIYNLAGQRVKKAQKGFYIIGGKKVLVK